MHKPEFIMKCILIIKLYLPMYVLKKKKLNIPLMVTSLYGKTFILA